MHLITYNMAIDYLNRTEDNEVVGTPNNSCLCPFANIIEEHRKVVGVMPDLDTDDGYKVEYIGRYGRVYTQKLPDWVSRAIKIVDDRYYDVITAKEFRKVIEDAVSNNPHKLFADEFDKSEILAELKEQVSNKIYRNELTWDDVDEDSVAFTLTITVAKYKENKWL